MEWSEEANGALARIPFFVRRSVKRKVEKEALRCGAERVELDHMEAARKRFLDRMEEEVKGVQVETCFGPGGCRNRAVDCDDMAQEVEKRASAGDMKAFLERIVDGPLKMHHEFRISISDCPNACSRPQIVDVGLIGACRPEISGEGCSGCGACVEVCRENAVSLEEEVPAVDESRCLACGQCIKACPTGALREGKKGYRILLGGKLGRRPRLAEELPGIHSPQEACAILDRCLAHYRRHCRKGERFGVVLERSGWTPEK